MNKILVTIFVLAIDESYDILLPINLKMVDALEQIQNTIFELSSGNYIKHKEVMLINCDGNVINFNNVVRLSGLKNGSRVILI